jgi:excisionase family DNA binding protein
LTLRAIAQNLKKKKFTPEQVAEFLQVSPRTILDLLRKKKIIGLKIGKEWRILQRDYEEFLEKNRE